MALSHNQAVGKKVYQNEGNRAVLGEIPEASRRVLDLGCGAGDNARMLGLRGVQVDGVTLSDSEALVAKQYCETVVIGDLERGLPAGLASGYDTVIASHVLEHICYPEKLLAGVHAVLAPSGLFVVALPNLLYWKYRLRLCCGNFDYDPSGIMDNTHFRWYSFKSARRMLEQNGFEVIKSYAEGSFPLPILRKYLPKTVTESVDRTAARFFPGLFGYQMIYTACSRIQN